MEKYRTVLTGRQWGLERGAKRQAGGGATSRDGGGYRFGVRWGYAPGNGGLCIRFGGGRGELDEFGLLEAAGGLFLSREIGVADVF